MTMPMMNKDRKELELVGTYCEIYWTASNRLAKRQCEKCVYYVRGIENNLVCVELIYDAIEGEHRQDKIYWVPTEAIQYMHVLTEAVAMRRIETLEREAYNDRPLD